MKNISSNYFLERVKNDMKLGIPVIFDDNTKKYLILAIESIQEETFNLFKTLNYEIIIPSIRAKTLYDITTKNSLRIKIKSQSINEIKDFADNSTIISSSFNKKEGEKNDKSIIKLVKSAELLPCIIIAKINNDEILDWCKQNNIFTIKLSDLQNDKNNLEINEICKAPLVLKDAKNTEIIIYKNYSKEHYAIIIGDALKQDQPAVRLHSSCYTGDLLDSLTCDCGGQLKSTIKFMSENNGGIILYLSQEGRSIGLTNKIRTYSEQILNNRDTVDANRSLGFEDDERDFFIGATILKKLNVSTIKLVTNNTRKISQLKKHGIDIKSCITSKIKYNKYNMHYLHTKFSKLGHIINY
ncbi:MAG: GTP cyclohydrolase II [Rickettsiaceae bacterium H1]|nr:GTP cyclohydrolase II [Rickettsiaceae bacterium H1]